MKRDNDLIREMLLEMEASEKWYFSLGSLGKASGCPSRVSTFHMLLMADAGLISKDEIILDSSGRLAETDYRLTNYGHDFLDAMRDEGIWSRTKDAVAQSGGNATLEIVKTIATGFLKKQIRDRTGIDV